MSSCGTGGRDDSDGFAIVALVLRHLCAAQADVTVSAELDQQRLRGGWRRLLGSPVERREGFYQGERRGCRGGRVRGRSIVRKQRIREQSERKKRQMMRTAALECFRKCREVPAGREAPCCWRSVRHRSCWDWRSTPGRPIPRPPRCCHRCGEVEVIRNR